MRSAAEPVDHGLEVDAGDELVEVRRGEHGVDVDPGEDAVDVHSLEEQIDVELVEYLVEVDAGEQRLEVDPIDDRVDVDLVDDRLDVHLVDESRRSMSTLSTIVWTSTRCTTSSRSIAPTTPGAHLVGDRLDDLGRPIEQRVEHPPTLPPAATAVGGRHDPVRPLWEEPFAAVVT